VLRLHITAHMHTDTNIQTSNLNLCLKHWIFPPALCLFPISKLTEWKKKIYSTLNIRKNTSNKNSACFQCSSKYCSMYISIQGSVVGIATGYKLDDWGVGVQVLVVSKIFSFSTSSRLPLGPTQPLIQWLLRLFPRGVKWLGREADHSPIASAEVKKMWIYTSTAPYIFMAYLSYVKKPLTYSTSGDFNGEVNVHSLTFKRWAI
jgi:hypothetical protein